MVYEINGKRVVVIVSPSADPQNPYFYACIWELTGPDRPPEPLTAMQAFKSQQEADDWTKNEFQRLFREHQNLYRG